jgi:hypothetical protein
LALREALAPERMLLLGTSGSTWDVLVEHLAVAGAEEDLRIEIIEAATASAVTTLVFAARTPKLAVVSSDAHDDKFIGCAAAVGAQDIVRRLWERRPRRDLAIGYTQDHPHSPSVHQDD